MSKYKEIGRVVNAFTFDEVVEYGRQSGCERSFKLYGYDITHYNDKSYLIPMNSESVRFTPDDMLVLDDTGYESLFPITIVDFKDQYTIIGDEWDKDCGLSRDIFGREIMVGDTVAFNPPVYKGMVTGSILKFSKKKVTVSYVPHGKQHTVKCSIFSGELVKAVIV